MSDNKAATISNARLKSMWISGAMHSGGHPEKHHSSVVYACMQDPRVTALVREILKQD